MAFCCSEERKYIFYVHAKLRAWNGDLEATLREWWRKAHISFEILHGMPKTSVL